MEIQKFPRWPKIDALGGYMDNISGLYYLQSMLLGAGVGELIGGGGGGLTMLVTSSNMKNSVFCA